MMPGCSHWPTENRRKIDLSLDIWLDIFFYVDIHTKMKLLGTNFDLKVILEESDKNIAKRFNEFQLWALYYYTRLDRGQIMTLDTDENILKNSSLILAAAKRPKILIKYSSRHRNFDFIIWESETKETHRLFLDYRIWETIQYIRSAVLWTVVSLKDSLNSFERAFSSWLKIFKIDTELLFNTLNKFSLDRDHNFIKIIYFDSNKVGFFTTSIELSLWIQKNFPKNDKICDWVNSRNFSLWCPKINTMFQEAKSLRLDIWKGRTPIKFSFYSNFKI